MCRILKLTLNVEGAMVDPPAYPKLQSKAPVQISLFEALCDVDNQQLDVKVLRKQAHSIDLQVSIDFKPQNKRA